MSKIVVTVEGPAGSGKSAVAQLIAMYLSRVELNATNDLNTDLRSLDELQVVVDQMIANKTIVEVREHQSTRDQARSETQLYADRYRYLRDTKADALVDGSCWVVQYKHPVGVIPEVVSAGFGSALDAAVDAARETSK